MRVRLEVEPPVEQDSSSAEQRYTGDSSFLRPLRDGDMVRVGPAISMPPMEMRDIPVNPAENPQATVLALHGQIVHLEELYWIAKRTEPESQAWQKFLERRVQLRRQVGQVADLFGQLGIALTPSPKRLRQLLDQVDGTGGQGDPSVKSIALHRRVSQAMDAVPETTVKPWASHMDGRYALE